MATKNDIKVHYRFPTGEKVVGMVVFRDTLIVATERALYRQMTPKQKPVELEVKFVANAHKVPD